MKSRTALLLLIMLAIPSICQCSDVEWKNGNTLLIATGYAIRFQEKDATLDTLQIQSQDAVMTYISGFIDCSLLTSSINSKALSFSIPRDVDTYQIARILHKFLEDHPETLHKQGDMLIFAAMTTAFPNKAFVVVKP